jgi:hypothetical protein
MASKLLAFREIEKSHSGENIAEIIYQVLLEDGILHKVTAHLILPVSLVLILLLARHDHLRQRDQQ